MNTALNIDQGQENGILCGESFRCKNLYRAQCSHVNIKYSLEFMCVWCRKHWLRKAYAASYSRSVICLDVAGLERMKPLQRLKEDV